MPLIIEGGRVPVRWAQAVNSRPAAASFTSDSQLAGSIRLALINNMPDAALEDTELQFFELIDKAAGEVPVCVKLYSLPGVPRGERGRAHLDSFYFDLEDLWSNHFDGVIITGTEPHQSNLRDEPYWKMMTDVFDWAEDHTISAVLSCLAAHASVLHTDGIGRYRLADKQFGVFESNHTRNHVLINNSGDLAGSSICFPHSRWNEVRETDLIASGYVVLAESAAGVDLFVKKKKSLFVYVQGHPEYFTETLLKEYRRDIKRFLRGERDTYPSQPQGYFDPRTVELLGKFQQSAMSNRQEDVMASFPDSVSTGLQNTWRAPAIGIYRNWLQYIASKKTDVSRFAAMASVSSNNQRKRTAAR